ncbi:MAG: hypothetical protein HQK61_00635 [Desulfamplus sp.]|nr:hypothetical protein [Desulfamplus sp.]
MSNKDEPEKKTGPPGNDLERVLENKKRTLFARFSDNKNLLKLTRGEMLKERASLQSAIEALEHKNHLSSRKLNDLDFGITERKKEKQRAEQEAERQNKELIRLLTEESGLANEIEFYISEKKQIMDALEKTAARMESSISAVEKSVRDIGFIRGETGALIEKIGRLENGIPEKSSDIEGLDDSIYGAIKALRELYVRMHSMEKSAKAHYYNLKGE